MKQFLGLRGVLVVAALALAGCSSVWAPASAGDANDVVVVKGYPGPVQDPRSLAVLFARDGDNYGEAQWFCEIDGHDLQRTIRLSQRCANVLVLSPGDHEMLWRYHSAQYRVGYRGHGNIAGTGRLHVHVEAGNVYELVVSGYQQSAGLTSSWKALDTLSYTDINPGFARHPIDYSKAEPLKDPK